MKISLKAHGIIWLLGTQGRMTLQQILEHCTDGRDAVKSALQELKAQGLVSMSECRSKGRFDSCYYALTADGKIVNGKTVAGKSTYGEVVENDAITPQAEKPLMENPPAVNLPQDIESEGITATVNGKSTYGEEVNDYIYLSNKGSNESKYKENSTTTLNTQDIHNSAKNENLAEQPKPNRKKREVKPTILFRESEFVKLADGLERFKTALIARNPAYELADLDYYYSAVLNWSDGKDNRKVDWIATAASFILGDEKKGGFKKSKTGLQHDTSGKINGIDAERIAARTARVLQKLGGDY